MKAINRIWVPVVMAVAAIALVPVTASADTATGRDFGQHVAACAQSMGGFTGTHNPGMHQGFAGWDGSTCSQ